VQYIGTLPRAYKAEPDVAADSTGRRIPATIECIVKVP
jgi:hypothetical protein